jgi:hypothetical protein
VLQHVVVFDADKLRWSILWPLMQTLRMSARAGRTKDADPAVIPLA